MSGGTGNVHLHHKAVDGLLVDLQPRIAAYGRDDGFAGVVDMLLAHFDENLGAHFVERHVASGLATLELDHVITEARGHGLTDVTRILEGECRRLECGVQSSAGAEVEPALVASHGRIVRQLRGKLGDVRARQQLCPRVVRGGQRGIPAAALRNVEKDVRDVDLLRNRVFRAIDEIELARPGQVSLHCAVEFGPSLALDAFDHEAGECPLDLQHQTPLHDRILVHPAFARSVRERPVDQYVVETCLHALRTGGKRYTLVGRDTRQFGVPIGTDQHGLRAAHKHVVQRFRHGGRRQRNNCECDGGTSTNESSSLAHLPRQSLQNTY